MGTANISVLACLLEKGVERMRRIGNANLPLTHPSNAYESTTGGDVAIVALTPSGHMRDRLIERLEYINIMDSKRGAADYLGDAVRLL
jgi:hypothetical protein